MSGSGSSTLAASMGRSGFQTPRRPSSPIRRSRSLSAHGLLQGRQRGHPHEPRERGPRGERHAQAPTSKAQAVPSEYHGPSQRVAPEGLSMATAPQDRTGVPPYRHRAMRGDLSIARCPDHGPSASRPEIRELVFGLPLSAPTPGADTSRGFWSEDSGAESHAQVYFRMRPECAADHGREWRRFPGSAGSGSGHQQPRLASVAFG